MVNSQFASDAEITKLINVAYARLHNIFVGKYEDYTVTNATIPLVAGTNTYTLPTDFFKERQFNYVSGGTTTPMRRFAFGQYGPMRSVGAGGGDLQFRILNGNTLYVAPTPSTGSIEIWYVPQCTPLVLDTDTLATFIPYGAEEYIIYDVAINLALKEESDISALVAMKRDFERELEAMMMNRNISYPDKVADVEPASA